LDDVGDEMKGFLDDQNDLDDEGGVDGVGILMMRSQE